MSGNNVTTEEQTIICVGATVAANELRQVLDFEKFSLDGLKWVDEQNLFVAFQNFYKKRPNLDSRTITPELRNKFYYEFFPMMLRTRGFELSPNPSKPTALKLNLDVASSKDPRMNIQSQTDRMAETMKTVLKNTSLTVQSFECEPKMTVAHIGPKALLSPDFRKTMDQYLSLNPKNTFYLDKLCLVEVTKGPNGPEYKFNAVE